MDEKQYAGSVNLKNILAFPDIFFLNAGYWSFQVNGKLLIASCQSVSSIISNFICRYFFAVASQASTLCVLSTHTNSGSDLGFPKELTMAPAVPPPLLPAADYSSCLGLLAEVNSFMLWDSCLGWQVFLWAAGKKTGFTYSCSRDLDFQQL